MSANAAQQVIRGLGYAGLIPFVVPAIVAVTAPAQAEMAVAIAEHYALAIICFLCGSWWGAARMSNSRAALLLSNAYLLLALALFLFTREWWSLAAALLLAGAWLCEQNGRLFPKNSPEYRRMRAILTLFAAASMLLIQFA
jgi:hypothetical protein